MNLPAGGDPLAGVTHSERNGALDLAILVAPRASRCGVGPVIGDRVRVSVNAPPVDGKANAAVVEAVAAAFGVRKAAVAITAGQRGKRKTVRVEGATAAALRALLAGPK